MSTGLYSLLWQGLGAFLAAYGAVLVFLQLEVPAKVLRAAMGYGGWFWGGPSDLPTAWGAPTDLEGPLRDLYSTLSLKQPLLPWIAWTAGAVVLIALTRVRRTDAGSGNDER